MMKSTAEFPRIVSTIASATEIVAALGLTDYLVGISHECDFPAEIKRLPVVTKPRVDVNASSRQIDSQIRNIVNQALSVYDIDNKTLQELKPTHIITQDQCDVCAVSIKDVESAMCELTGVTCQIISLRPNCLSDFFDDILRVGNALGASDQAEMLIDRLRTRIHNIATQLKAESKSKTVVAIEWMDPLMVSGNWMPELIELAGGQALFSQAGKHSPMLEWSKVKETDPDFILVNPCGFSIERTMQEFSVLESQIGWGELKAVKANHVYVLDGNQYFNRPGPRLLESLEILAEILHPDIFHFGHQETGWISVASPTRA